MKIFSNKRIGIIPRTVIRDFFQNVDQGRAHLMLYETGLSFNTFYYHVPHLNFIASDLFYDICCRNCSHIWVVWNAETWNKFLTDLGHFYKKKIKKMLPAATWDTSIYKKNRKIAVNISIFIHDRKKIHLLGPSWRNFYKKDLATIKKTSQL